MQSNGVVCWGESGKTIKIGIKCLEIGPHRFSLDTSDNCRSNVLWRWQLTANALFLCGTFNQWYVFTYSNMLLSEEKQYLFYFFKLNNLMLQQIATGKNRIQWDFIGIHFSTCNFHWMYQFCFEWARSNCVIDKRISFACVLTGIEPVKSTNAIWESKLWVVTKIYDEKNTQKWLGDKKYIIFTACFVICV